MKVVLVVVLMVLISSAAVAVEIKEVTTGIAWEENPAGCTTACRTLTLNGDAGKYSFSFTDEAFSCAYSRQSIYIGKKGELTKALLRVDELDRAWIGINHVQPLSKRLTLVVRPMAALKRNTAPRGYVFLDYRPGGKFGVMLVTLSIRDHYVTDIYVGPTYRHRGFGACLAPSLTKSKCWYADLSYTIPIK